MKKILWMFCDSSACGQSKVLAHDLPYKKDIEYFTFSFFFQFDVCQLPTTIDLCPEITKCIKSSPFSQFYDDVQESFDFLRDTDFSVYSKIVVWINCKPDTLIFLYMLCQFIPEKLYVRDYGKSELVVFKEIMGYKNVQGSIFTGMQESQEFELTDDEKAELAKRYMAISGGPKCAKRLDNDYNIVAIPDDIIYSKILEVKNPESLIPRQIAIIAYIALDKNVNLEYIVGLVKKLVEEGKLNVRDNIS